MAIVIGVVPLVDPDRERLDRTLHRPIHMPMSIVVAALFGVGGMDGVVETYMGSAA